MQSGHAGRSWEGSKIRECDLTMDIQSEVYYRGDGRLLEMAMDNVLSNAVIYSPAGARVAVSLKNRLFSVENSGVHLPEEDLKQIF